MKKRIGLVLIILTLSYVLCDSTFACRQKYVFRAKNPNIYLAPKDMGKADGSSRKNAAFYARDDIWKKVNALLKKSPVVVWLINGNYSTAPLQLVEIGNEKNQLTIKGESLNGVIFNASIPCLISLYGCQNIILENLNFTGNATSYALKITKNYNKTKLSTPAALKAAHLTVSKYITVKNCNWYDMPQLYYGASGAHYGSHHITFEHCTFKRIGLNTHCHMIYNAYDSDYVSVLDCYFEDCSGSYVRFRDRCDYGIVHHCKFVSTGKYVHYNPKTEAFIEIPVFINVNPGDEYFGNNFIFTKNTFIFTPNPSAIRCGIRYHHSGFDPKGWHYILTAKEGAILEGTDVLAKKRLLKKNFGIDLDTVIVSDNVWKNENCKMIFTSWIGYGAKSKGWHNDKAKKIDLTDVMLLCNRRPKIREFSNVEYTIPEISEPMYKVIVRKNVSYLPAGRKEKCDFYMPEEIPADTRLPAIVLIHGGGWKGGRKDGKRQVQLGMTLARYGYVCMSIDYLLCKGKDSPSWPQNLYDCKLAVKFLRKNADKLHIDPKHIGAIGGSAGGHLTAMLAVTGDDKRLEPKDTDTNISSKIQAAVDLYGITDLTTWPRRYIADVLGATKKENIALWKLASPINHVTEDDPPMLIIHGTADRSVSYKQSIAFFKVLSAKAVPSRLILIEGAPHTIPMWKKAYENLMPVIIDFFDRHLKNDI